MGIFIGKLTGEWERLNNSPAELFTIRAASEASFGSKNPRPPPGLPLALSSGSWLPQEHELTLNCAPPPGISGGVQDFALYQQLLGLSAGWQVTGVDLQIKAGKVEVRGQCPDALWACSTCLRRMRVLGYEARRWRHLDSCQFQTILVCPVPRVACSEHGSQTVQIPWAESYGRFTALFERRAIDLMLACSTEAASDRLGISWEEADGIKQRAVKRGLARKQARPLARLGVDEKAFGRGHDYVTVVAHIQRDHSATVEYAGDGRKRETLDAFWLGLTEGQRAGVQAVGMDRWEPYQLSTATRVPQAAIVRDPFHLVRYLNDAVDQVRQQDHRRLSQQGDGTLKGTQYWWLYGEENLPEKHRAACRQLKESPLKTGRAWSLKVMFRNFRDCATVAGNWHYFGSWYSWAIRSRLEPVKKLALTFNAASTTASLTSTTASPTPRWRTSTVRSRALSKKPAAFAIGNGSKPTCSSTLAVWNSTRLNEKSHGNPERTWLIKLHVGNTYLRATHIAAISLCQAHTTSLKPAVFSVVLQRSKVSKHLKLSRRLASISLASDTDKPLFCISSNQRWRKKFS